MKSGLQTNVALQNKLWHFFFQLAMYSASPSKNLLIELNALQFQVQFDLGYPDISDRDRAVYTVNFPLIST